MTSRYENWCAASLIVFSNKSEAEVGIYTGLSDDNRLVRHITITSIRKGKRRRNEVQLAKEENLWKISLIYSNLYPQFQNFLRSRVHRTPSCTLHQSSPSYVYIREFLLLIANILKLVTGSCTTHSHFL